MSTTPSSILDLLIPNRATSGNRILHYRVGRVLGEGGMGCVFEAFDERLERTVAIKVLKPSLSNRSESREKFLREARSLASVRHQNVVTVFAVEDARLPFIVMERLEGETLMSRLASGQAFDCLQAVDIGRQMASGLAAAHAAGVLHRDIKPHNVVLENGIVRLLDFGLSVSLRQELCSVGVAGTPYYMAPEQVQDEPIDERTDLYALGVVLYRLLTGHFPFGDLSSAAALVAVTTRAAPSLSTWMPGASVELVRLVDQLLSRNPDDRVQSAGEVAHRLAAVEAELRSGIVSQTLRLLRNPQVWVTISACAIPLMFGLLATAVALPNRVVGKVQTIDLQSPAADYSLPLVRLRKQVLLPDWLHVEPTGKQSGDAKLGPVRNIARFKVDSTGHKLDTASIELIWDHLYRPIGTDSADKPLQFYLATTRDDSAGVASILSEDQPLSMQSSMISLGSILRYDEQLAGSTSSASFPSEILADKIRQSELPCSLMIVADTDEQGRATFATIKLKLSWLSIDGANE